MRRYLPRTIGAKLLVLALLALGVGSTLVACHSTDSTGPYNTGAN